MSQMTNTAKRDEEGADDAGDTRQDGDGPNVNVHGPNSSINGIRVAARWRERQRSRQTTAGERRPPAGCALLLRYLTASASSISFWPSGTSLANFA